MQASDADPGRNGQLFFSMDDSQDANSAFTIDSLSGDIFTLSDFDYESSSKKLYKLKIIASDNGIPRKSSFVFVYISINDQNDHCPIFRSPQMKFWNISRNTPPGTLLTVISADDKDSGLNGEVRYSLSYTGNHKGAFKVDEQSGEVAIADVLKLMEYRLQVIARDLGVPSCSRQIELTVNTFDDPEVTEVASEVTTGVRTEGRQTVLFFRFESGIVNTLSVFLNQLFELQNCNCGSRDLPIIMQTYLYVFISSCFLFTLIS